jgi:mono/diheme cytochrome c family protein
MPHPFVCEKRHKPSRVAMMRDAERARRVPVGPIPPRAVAVGFGRRAGLLTCLVLLALPFRSPHRPAWAGSAALPHDPAAVREGYRRYQGVCGHCHGPDGLGSSFASGLIAPLPNRERFAAVVLGGASGPRGVMRGFAGDPNVEPYLDAIYAYLAERASGRLGRGRPGAAAGTTRRR